MSEYKLLAALRSPQNHHIVWKIKDDLFTDSRVELFHVWRKTLERFGHLETAAIEAVYQKPIPDETVVPLAIDPIPLIDRLYNAAVNRRMEEVARDMLAAAKRNEGFKPEFKNRLEGIQRPVEYDVSLSAGVSSFLSDIGSKIRGDYAYCSTGLRFLDSVLGGEWPKGEYTIISGATGGGKCLNGDVLLSTGEYRHISQIVPGDYVVTLDENTHKFVDRRVIETLAVGEKRTFLLKTARGFVLKTSDIHPYFTQDGWKQVKDMSVGDYIATVGNTGHIEGKAHDHEWVKFLGYVIGDGTLRSGNIRFSNVDPVVLDDFTQVVRNLGGDVSIEQSGLRVKGNTSITARIDAEGLRVNSNGKFVPDYVMRADKETIRLFLTRLYATDGWASVGSKKQEIGYCTVSRKLAENVVTLLARFGIPAKLRTKSPKYTYKDELRIGQIAYQVIVSDRDHVIRFCDDIGIFSKELAVNAVKQSAMSHTPTGSNDVIPAVFVTDRAKTPEGRKSYRRAKAMRLNPASCGDVFWDKVIAVEELDTPVEMWDLEIEGTKNFIANHIVAHNTALAGDSALKMALEDKAVDIYSLEMPKKSLVLRWVAQLAEVDARILRSGRETLTRGISEDKLARIDSAVARLNGLPIYINDTPGLDALQIAGSIRNNHAEYGTRAVFLDYLQIMAYDRSAFNMHYGINEGLKVLANTIKELDIPLIILAQRHKDDKRVKDVGNAVEHAAAHIDIELGDIIDETTGTQSAIVELLKNRHGPTGQTPVLYNRKHLFFFGNTD